MHVGDSTLVQVGVLTTERNRAFWLGQGYAPQRIIDNSESLETIILPWTNFRENTSVTFPQGTSHFFKYLQKNLNDVGLDILADESSFSELALHSREYRLPLTLANYLILPLVLSVTANYIYDKLQTRPADKVYSSFIIECSNGDAVTIEYTGPAEQFEDRVMFEYRNWCSEENATRDGNDQQ